MPLTQVDSDNNAKQVVFGTGPLGLAVMGALVDEGYTDVTAVNRSGKAEVPAGVKVIAGDAYSAEFTRQVCQDAAVVYMCAQPAYTEWPQKFPPLAIAA